MKCLLCEKLSVQIICGKCQDEIPIIPRKRAFYDGFTIYSFFDYQHIEYLLRSKYSLVGSRIYAFLAKKAARYFANSVKGDFNGVWGIGIDDKVGRFYSHSGVIVRAFRKSFKPHFGALRATNDIHYAGKSLTYRQTHPKGFVYSGKRDILAVLLDDIVTTGTSIKEAREVLENNGVSVLFALTLSDARF